MTELEKENEELEEIRAQQVRIINNDTDRIEKFKKENAELKEQISTLLSCSNCPDNKGGYVCEKEYNDKCLAQKIQYIKELKEEIEKMKCCENCKNKKGWKGEKPCLDCKYNPFGEGKEDKWELAE